MRRRLPVAGPLLVAAVAALIALGPAAGSAGAVKLTFIGDSKAAAIGYTGKAKRLLSRGHDVRRDFKVCRRLVAPSCPSNGITPLTTLEAVRHYGTDLGSVLVIDVGYNDSSAAYRGHLNRVMRAALSSGVQGVVWVNLRAVRADYSEINRIIKRAKNRWHRLYVANWNRLSRGHPDWLSPTIDDGIHLSKAGAVGLVRLVRRYIPLAAQGPRDAAASQVTLDFTTTTEAESSASELVGSSPPVGSNLGTGDDGSTGLSGVLPFAGGAALMLFLVFVTLKRRADS